MFPLTYFSILNTKWQWQVFIKLATRDGLFYSAVGYIVVVVLPLACIRLTIAILLLYYY